LSAIWDPIDRARIRAIHRCGEVRLCASGCRFLYRLPTPACVQSARLAVESILKAGHIPAGMELFTARDQTQLQVIRRRIEESDVFLLILGGRYGRKAA
jgi:Domain of unknown function (DUF4062)